MLVGSSCKIKIDLMHKNLKFRMNKLDHLLEFYPIIYNLKEEHVEFQKFQNIL